MFQKLLEFLVSSLKQQVDGRTGDSMVVTIRLSDDRDDNARNDSTQLYGTCRGPGRECEDAAEFKPGS